MGQTAIVLQVARRSVSSRAVSTCLCASPTVSTPHFFLVVVYNGPQGTCNRDRPCSSTRFASTEHVYGDVRSRSPGRPVKRGEVPIQEERQGES